MALLRFRCLSRSFSRPLPLDFQRTKLCLFCDSAWSSRDFSVASPKCSSRQGRSAYSRRQSVRRFEPQPQGERVHGPGTKHKHGFSLTQDCREDTQTCLQRDWTSSWILPSHTITLCG